MKNDRDSNGLTSEEHDRERNARRVMEFKRNLDKMHHQKHHAAAMAHTKEVIDPLTAAGPSHYEMPVYAFGKQKRPQTRLSWWQRLKRKWI